MMTTTTATPTSLVAARSPRRRHPFRTLGRLARKKPLGAVAGVLCILLILIAVFADVIAPQRADQLGNPRLAPPSLSHPMGTDNLFRDQYSRILIGSRISLGIGFAAVFVGTLLGASIGLISAYAGGWVDLVMNRVTDTVMAFPPLVLSVFMLSIFQPTFLTVSVAIGVIITPATARIVRGAALSVKNLAFVEAASSIGAGRGRIILQHILPNVVAPIIVIASIQIGNAILAEAALSFLSLGVATDEMPSWGKMLQDTRQVWQRAWWTAVMPGMAISVAVLSFNLFGDALRDVLDPRLRGS